MIMMMIKIVINIKSYLSRSDWPYADLGVGVVGAQLMMMQIKMMKITVMKIKMMKITVMKIGSELQVQQFAYMF